MSFSKLKFGYAFEVFFAEWLFDLVLNVLAVDTVGQDCDRVRVADASRRPPLRRAWGPWPRSGSMKTIFLEYSRVLTLSSSSGRDTG